MRRGHRTIKRGSAGVLHGWNHHVHISFLKEICPRGNNKVDIYICLYHDKCLLFMLELSQKFFDKFKVVTAYLSQGSFGD